MAGKNDQMFILLIIIKALKFVAKLFKERSKFFKMHIHLLKLDMFAKYNHIYTHNLKATKNLLHY
ncbi:hypothetical protein T12_5570 [Trichinella patagoniensis]|uniref:Uncharacterized protein n=1 Tax=Trichinella patagoniensis TaxID=990121 RepID=A0A0V1A0Z4_9BILA|nr:hypothetical protein T12_5570 [Trichinella patagoniensis]